MESRRKQKGFELIHCSKGKSTKGRSSPYGVPISPRPFSASTYILSSTCLNYCPNAWRGSNELVKEDMGAVSSLP